MGLIKAAKESISSMLAEQWREYFYCDSLSNDVLALKASKKVKKGKTSNTVEDNIITNGSIIAVNEGQCMIIVDQGQVVEFCADPGEFVYDASTEPSMLYGDLEVTVEASVKKAIERFTFGGAPAKDQRVYYFNLKENTANLFGTANPVPFRVVDNNIGLDVDIAVRCNGEYSFRIVDPLVFYANVCGNVMNTYKKADIAGQMKAELLTALQPAFARISAMGVRYSAVAAHTMELTEALKQELSVKWRELRGIELVSMAINSIKASEEDEEMIKNLQKTAVLRNTSMAAATLTEAQAAAMKAAASNTATGPMMAFAGMNMASMAGGMDANQLYAMGMQPQGQPAQPQMQSQAQKGWACSCGSVNLGKFCSECGQRKPAGAPLYRCDKCGFEPADPTRPPKFCPECGDAFDDNDVVM